MAMGKPTFVSDPNFPGLYAGRLQITAGATLLHQSKLVEWCRKQQGFVRVPEHTFEYAARNDVHPAFGRLMCWLTFSAGAEYFAKGVCVERDINFWSSQKPGNTCAYPDRPIGDWLLRTNGKPPSRQVDSFGAIGALTYEHAGRSALLDLAEKMHAGDAAAAAPDARRLLGAYNVLRMAIRNRDAHAYVPNVRAKHHWLVEELFLDALNLLVRWVPNGGGVRLQQWMDESVPFLEWMAVNQPSPD
jgi:hypothetical protein